MAVIGYALAAAGIVLYTPVKWLSPRDIEIAFDGGRVTSFTNSAIVYRKGPVPDGFHATLREGRCEVW